MDNPLHNLRRNCQLSASYIVSDLSDCEDSSGSDSIPFADVNPANYFPSSRPPNFTKSQIRRHFGVPEKKEMIASTPVFRIRKRKSDTPSETSLSLSPIEKQNSVQACHIISVKKPEQVQIAKKSGNFDADLQPQAMEMQEKEVATAPIQNIEFINRENGKATSPVQYMEVITKENEKAVSPVQDTEVITRKKRFSTKANIKKENEQLSIMKEKQQTKEVAEGNPKIMKEVSSILMPVVKLIRLPININNPTINKSIQLSCSKKKRKKREQVESNKLENKLEYSHDVLNGEALAVEDKEKLPKKKTNTPNRNPGINNNSTINNSIQLSCSKKKRKKSEQVESNELETKVEYCHDLLNGEALAVEVEEKLPKKNTNTPNRSLGINKGLIHQEKRNLSRKKNNDNKKSIICKTLTKNWEENEQFGAETERTNFNNSAREQAKNEEIFEEHEQSIEVIDLMKENTGSIINVSADEMISDLTKDTDSLQPLLDQVDNDVNKYLESNNEEDDFPKKCDLINFMKRNSSNLNEEKETDKRSFFDLLLQNEAFQNNLLNKSKKPNENSNRSEDTILPTLDSSTSESRDKMNKTTKQHYSSNRLQPKKLFSFDIKNNKEPPYKRHNKLINESVRQNVNNIEECSNDRHNAEVNLKEKADSFVNNEIGNIKPAKNLVNTRIEDASFVRCNNDKTNLSNENMNMGSNRCRSASSGDVKKNRKSIIIKSKEVGNERNKMNFINEIKTSRKKSKEKVDNKTGCIEKIHETRKSVTRKSKINNANTVVNNDTIYNNKKSLSKALPELRTSENTQKEVKEMQNTKHPVKKSRKERNKKEEMNPKMEKSELPELRTSKNTQKEVKEMQNTKHLAKISRKEGNKKEEINPKMEKSEQVNKREGKTTTKNNLTHKYAKVLHDLLQQRGNTEQFITTINECQTSGERRSSRTRKQTRTFSLETFIGTEKQFLSYYTMKFKESTRKRSKKSHNFQKTEFKVPVPPSTSKKESTRKISENSSQSNLSDSGNYSTSSRLLQMAKSTVDNNLDILPDNVQANLVLGNDVFMPPIIEENVTADVKNDDNTQKNISSYNLRNKNTEMEEMKLQQKNKSQKEMREDNQEQNSIHTNQNEMENPTNRENHEPVDGSSSRQSSRNTKKRQLNEASVENKNIDREPELINSKIKILRTTICEEIIDKENSKKTINGTTNVLSESNQSLTMLPASANYYELNDVCYVINNCAVKTPWYQKIPELVPVKGQNGLYIGYYVSNRNLGFCTCSTGLMQIDPNCIKRLCYFKTSHAFYFVIEGEAEVTLGQRKMQVQVEESFFVPLGHDYSIRNASNTEKLLLSFTNIKAPKFPT